MTNPITVSSISDIRHMIRQKSDQRKGITARRAPTIHVVFVVVDDHIPHVVAAFTDSDDAEDFRDKCEKHTKKPVYDADWWIKHPARGWIEHPDRVFLFDSVSTRFIVHQMPLHQTRIDSVRAV